MHFLHIFLFIWVTSRSSIDIHVISIFNNQLCMRQRHENDKIICKQCSIVLTQWVLTSPVPECQNGNF